VLQPLALRCLPSPRSVEELLLTNHGHDHADCPNGYGTEQTEEELDLLPIDLYLLQTHDALSLHRRIAALRVTHDPDDTPRHRVNAGVRDPPFLNPRL
jgi:hypothetical protein